MEVQLLMSLERLLGEVCGSTGALRFETTYSLFLLKKQNETKTTPPKPNPSS